MKTSLFISRLFVLLLIITFSSSINSQGIYVNARAYLQGPLVNSTSAGETHLRPLMRDNLRQNPYNNQRVIPDQDIYKVEYIVNAHTSVDVTDKFTHVGCGTFSQYTTIPDPFTVFAVEGENAIVDWVFVELRDKDDYASVIATRAGLLQRDGDIVDIDGTSKLFFNDVTTDYYFVVIRHRNHLGVMTKFPLHSTVIEDLVYFTTSETPVFDFGNTNNEFNYSGLAQKDMTVIGVNVKALWGGDSDSDGVVSYNGDVSDMNIMTKEVVAFDPNLNPEYRVNFTQAIGYLQSDFDMDGRAKFTAPDDDRNLLFEQVLLYVQNTETRANFGLLKEQLPR